MYHIKSDKRSQTSAKLICDALLQCLYEKPFGKISISDIQKESSVSRATFYRLFDSLPDVLEYMCDELLLRFAIECSESNISEDNIFRAFIDYCVKNAYFFELLRENKCLDILYKCHNKKTDALTDVMYFFMGEKYQKYYTAILSSILVTVGTVWLENGQNETAEELDMIRRTIINPAFFKRHSDEN